MTSGLQRPEAPRSACCLRAAHARIVHASPRLWPNALAVALLIALGACTGGPHPLPPSPSPVAASPKPPSASPTTEQPGGFALAGSRAPAPVTPPANVGAAGASVPAAAAAAGSGMPAAGTGAAAAGSGGAGAAGSAATPPVPAGPTTCDGVTGALRPSEGGPRNLLLLLDRSLDTASEFEGMPRWQLASQAVQRMLSPHTPELMLGAVLYPSDSPLGQRCTGPAWLCARPSSAMCAVNPMAADDQIAFQPAVQALAALVGPEGLYAPAMASGVPLGEGVIRADAALAAQSLTGPTTVVILASGLPSCQWDAAASSEMLARWSTDHAVTTHVIALPGSAPNAMQALAALAEAGGSSRVLAPEGAAALEATLQSIVFGSLSSCTLELDPPANPPASAQLLVTEAGLERVVPRSAASGEAQWSISEDGKVVHLLGALCDAAISGEYDGLRVRSGCAAP